MDSRNLNNDKLGKIIIAIAFLFVLIGLFVIGIFLYLLSYKYSIPNETVNLQNSGQFGDYIGGVVGTIWALASVLLFYSTLRLQRMEFKLQRQATLEQRQEFSYSRILDVIYKQIHVISDMSLNLKLYDEESDKIYYGYNTTTMIGAIIYFEMGETNKDKKLSKILTFHQSRENIRFVDYLRNSLTLFINLIEAGDSSKLPILDKETKKQLYYIVVGNLDIDNIEYYLKIMKKAVKEMIEYPQKEEKDENDFLVRSENHLNVISEKLNFILKQTNTI